MPPDVRRSSEHLRRLGMAVNGCVISITSSHGLQM